MAKKNGTEPRGEPRDPERPAEIVEVRISPGELLATLARVDLEAALAYDEAAELTPDEPFRTELAGFAEDHRRHFDLLNALLEREGAASVAPPAAGAPVLAGILQLAGPLGADVIAVALLGNEQLTNLSYDAALAYEWDDATEAMLARFAADEQRHLARLAEKHDELASHAPERPGAPGGGGPPRAAPGAPGCIRIHAPPRGARSRPGTSATSGLRVGARRARIRATWRLHMAPSTDRIEKQVVLRAPLDRVWRAIADAREFGAWFGVAFDGAFAPGARLAGRIVPTTVDPEVAASQRPYEGTRFEIVVDRVEPMRRLSFRWHPYAVDPGVSYASEPMTLVTFELEEVAGGTRLTITESGFDALPLARRARAFEMNEHGWAAQAKLVERYVGRAPGR